MPHSYLPQQQAGQKKQAGCNGQQGIISFAAVKKIQKRIILNQSIRHHKGAQEKNPSAVNADGIFSVFSGTVCKNVHKFQSFYSEKADRGVNKKYPAKDHCAANKHKDHGQDLEKSPVNVTDPKAPDKHYNCL